MGNKGKNRFIKTFAIGVLMLFGGLALASENVIYVINNNSPRYSSGSYGGIMCTDGGGICTNGNYIMTSSRVRYVAPLWKRPTIRERKLTEGRANLPYYYRQAYYR